jgi:hypothetical protein
METDQGHGWLEDCQRVVTEFNDVAVPAFRQEFGEYEDLLMISMQLQAVEEDTQLNVGPRAVFVVECATGLVFKIGSNGRLHADKCVGHITGITGQELYRWLWW